MPFTPINPQQKSNSFTPVNPQERSNSINVGGVPLSLGQKLFQPNLSSNPIVAGVQQFGTGVGKGAAETIRGLGQAGTLIQSGINKATGLNLPVTDAYQEGGLLEQSTTPEGGLQKAGYVTQKVAELVTPLGKEKGANSVISGVAKGTAETIKTAESIATGIPKEVITRAASANYAPKIEKAITEIAEHPNQPYFTLAQKTGTKIGEVETTASKNLNNAVNEFKQFQGSTRFDVSTKIAPISKALAPFSTSGIKVVQSKVDGKFGRYIIGKSQQSPFTDKEVFALQDIMDTIRNSKNIEIDDVLALRKKFSSAYDAIPLGVNGNPRPYHAALMAMKEEAEKSIDELLPKALKQANAEYRNVQAMKDAFGNRLVDSQGNLKDTAETFLSNLGNLNKGELRAKVKAFEDMTGIDLVDEIQVMKDAQKLSPLFASTGSRNQDIFRVIAVMAGASTGGPLGTVAGLSLTSPAVVGKVATTIGKVKGAVARLLEGVKKSESK